MKTMVEPAVEDSQWPIWEVFLQEKSGDPHVHAGSLHAPDAETALLNARDVYARRNEAVSIWIVESRHIVATTPEDNPSFFEPAADKIYRHPQFYVVPRGVRSADERRVRRDDE